MSKTNHLRDVTKKSARTTRDDVTQRRQPRPALRRQGTRAGVIRRAMQEV